MPNYDIACANGHEMEVTRAIDARRDPCPTCGADVELVWKAATSIVQDEIPGGQWFENGFDQPRKFYSHSEHRAALAAEGMMIRAKWAGPLDKYLTRWDTPSQKTLDDAKVLLSRGRPEVKPADVIGETFPDFAIEKQDAGTFKIQRSA